MPLVAQFHKVGHARPRGNAVLAVSDRGDRHACSTVSTPSAPEQATTGLSCPDCLGVLAVFVGGRGHRLHFRCRIGHAYSLEEVIAGKEKRIEEYLWSALTAMSELATLLSELRPSQPKAMARAYTKRVKLVARQQKGLRQVIADNQPTAFESGEGPGGKS